MSLDRGGVQRQGDGVSARFRQGLEDRTPSAFLGPAVKAIVDRRVGAVLARAIAPPPTTLQHVDDAADDTPVIVPLWTRQAGWQMSFDARPLPVVQPKQTRTHSLALQTLLSAENHIVTIRYRP